MYQLPAEWEAQDAVLFAWPDERTDWCDNLEDVRRTYLAIFCALCPVTPILLLVRPDLYESVKQKLHTALESIDKSAIKLKLIPVEFNDTWTRDYASIICYRNDSRGKTFEVLDFQFNAWGNKFECEKDNRVNDVLFENNIFSKNANLVHRPFVLEGGSIESDGKKSILTTTQCLLNENRNGDVTKNSVEKILASNFGSSNILWLEHGEILGDDTDSHIDTLARFAPDNTIVYQSCDNENDAHYLPLKRMANQLANFTNANGGCFNLVPLPLPSPKFSASGDRLPATYANFLISNHHVLVPTYSDDADQNALKKISEAFPNYTIIGIECSPLIQQHGSLHCISMQVPAGALANDIFSK